MARRPIVNPESVRPGMITKVTDIPNATDKIITETAHFYGLNKSVAENIITFMGKYSYDVMTAGTMEAIALPHFGKFAPNLKLLQAKTRRKRSVHNFPQLLELAIKSKQTNFKPQVNPNATEPQTENEANSSDEDFEEDDSEEM